MIENHKIDEAENALKTALKWNPVSTTIMGELSEVYKMKKDYENYLYWSKRIIQYASSSKMLARGYRNIAYYYCDIGEYEKSAAIYYFSRYFEESKQVTSELFYIAEQLGKLLKHLKLTILRNFSSRRIFNTEQAILSSVPHIRLRKRV